MCMHVILNVQQIPVLSFWKSLRVFCFLNTSDCQVTEFADEEPTPTDTKGKCSYKIIENNLEVGESFELQRTRLSQGDDQVKSSMTGKGDTDCIKTKEGDTVPSSVNH